MKGKIYRKGQKDAEAFRALPERAQEIWFEYCDKNIELNAPDFDNLTFIYVHGLDYSNCNSPIEVIFNFAFDLLVYAKGIAFMHLSPQYEVYINSKKRYFVDFAFIPDEELSLNSTEFKLAIECDGHDFHEKTKEQVIKDNEREYDLKMHGFDVLRFSGSQIYNDPFYCALQTIKYIDGKVG